MPVAAGTVCVQANVGVDVAVDITGYFGGSRRLQFQPLSPVRMFDSRLAAVRAQPGHRRAPLATGQVVRLAHRRPPGRAGQTPRRRRSTSPASRPAASSFITAYPCGTVPLRVQPQHLAAGSGVTANGAMVKLSNDGDLCVYSPNAVHLVVDINGVWI